MAIQNLMSLPLNLDAVVSRASTRAGLLNELGGGTSTARGSAVWLPLKIYPLRVLISIDGHARVMGKGVKIRVPRRAGVKVRPRRVSIYVPPTRQTTVSKFASWNAYRRRRHLPL